MTELIGTIISTIFSLGVTAVAISGVFLSIILILIIAMLIYIIKLF